MKASFLRSPLLMGCLLLSLVGQGVCEERRGLRFGSTFSDSARDPHLAVVKLAAENLDWKAEYFECPFKRCLFMMGSGDLDMMGLLFKTPEREASLYYIEPPYAAERIVFYFLKGRGSEIREYKDLSDLTIGVMVGVKHFEPFNSDVTLDKFVVPFDEQRFKMLQAGRVDTFVGDEITDDILLKESNFKGQFEKSPYRVNAGNDYYAISKKSPYAKDRFTFGEVLKQLVDSGKVKEIYNKYGVEWNPPTQQAPK